VTSFLLDENVPLASVHRLRGAGYDAVQAVPRELGSVGPAGNPWQQRADGQTVVVGANGVVNAAARHDRSSPVYGMPIIDADISAASGVAHSLRFIASRYAA